MKHKFLNSILGFRIEKDENNYYKIDNHSTRLCNDDEVKLWKLAVKWNRVRKIADLLTVVIVILLTIISILYAQNTILSKMYDTEHLRNENTKLKSTLDSTKLLKGIRYGNN